MLDGFHQWYVRPLVPVVYMLNGDIGLQDACKEPRIDYDLFGSR
jgi:hypothetical protein